MPSNRIQIPPPIKNHPLPARKLHLLIVPSKRLRTKSTARPERIFVKWWLTAMHVEILHILEYLGVVVDLVAIESASVVYGTPDINGEIDG